MPNANHEQIKAGLDRDSWKKECISLSKTLTPTEFFRKVSEMAAAPKINSFDQSYVYQNAFWGACIASKKEHAKIIFEQCINGKQYLDIGMGNYLILKHGDLESLKIYSSLVDMNKPKGTDDDWCHIHILAIYNEVDKLNYCHEIGYATDEGYDHFSFTTIMVASGHFASAKAYAAAHPHTPSLEQWDKAIHKLAKNHEGRKVTSPIARLECLKGIYPDYRIYSTDPVAAIYNALGNNGVDIAQYFLNNGAPKHLITKTEAVEAMFNSKFGLAYVFRDAVDWLLNLGAEFSEEQLKKIILDQSHRKNGEATVERLAALVKDVPWDDMLVKSLCTEKDDVINRVKHLSRLHTYSQDDYKNAISIVTKTYGKSAVAQDVYTKLNIGAD